MFGSSFAPFATAVLIVGVSVAASLLVLWVVRRLIAHDRLTPHNEVSGFVYAAIGVIYAVILGFVVISVWEQYSDAESNARAEANAVGTLYRIAGGLPRPSAGEVEVLTLAYADSVVNEEWGEMAEDAAPSQRAIEDMDALWSALLAVEITTMAEQEVYDAALAQMDSLSSHRRERLEDAGTGLLGVMWAVMIVGGALTVLFPCLFGVEDGLVHGLIIATLAAAIGLMLFTVYELDHPFRGSVTVQPEGFRLVLEQFGIPAP